MASPLRISLFLLCFTIITLIISVQFTKINGSFSEQSNIVLPSNHHHRHHHHMEEKFTHLHFFLHEILIGETPSVVRIIDTYGKSPNGIGTTFMMDDALTEGPEQSSKEVGRAQGIFGLASINDRGMVMMINLVFSEGEYEGSTLSVLGRNPVQDNVRELPIVGGTGVFRFARGYAVIKSLWSISSEEHFVVEYNVTVSHP